jgi:hypothetical protein
VRRLRSAKQLPNRNAKLHLSLKRARQLLNVKRRHNVRQLHNRLNARLLRNSTQRLRKTKTSTPISCGLNMLIRRASAVKPRGCRRNRRALTTPPVDNRKGNRENNRNNSPPKGVFT